MKATIVYFSLTGRNAQIAGALDHALSERGYEVKRVSLQTAKRMCIIGALFRSLLARTVDLIDPPQIGEEELLAVVGPVWAGEINPPIRTFLNTLPDLGSRPVINVVGGFNPHRRVVREIDRILNKRNAGVIVSESLRLRDIDTPEKQEVFARDIVDRAVSEHSF